jgi:serine/threonine protein phosphatase PrpC
MTLLFTTIHEVYPGHFVHALHLHQTHSRVEQALWTYTTGEGWAGSTAALVRLEEEAPSGPATAFVAWVGDSRAYLLRSGRVLERTRDHKLVQELIDSGQLTEQEARRTSLSSVITRALGGRPPGTPPVVAGTLAPWRLFPEDRIVICSDGLCDLVDDDELAVLVDRDPPDEVCARLIDVANERGGHDNITVIVGAWDATFGPLAPSGDDRGRQALLVVVIAVVGIVVAWAVHAVRTGGIAPWL